MYAVSFPHYMQRLTRPQSGWRETEEKTDGGRGSADWENFHQEIESKDSIRPNLKANFAPLSFFTYLLLIGSTADQGCLHRLT